MLLTVACCVASEAAKRWFYRTASLQQRWAADLLVLGSRGYGAIAGGLLGSVASGVIHGAPCPVLVVRGDHA